MTLKKVVDWAKKSVILSRWFKETTEEEYYMSENLSNLPDEKKAFIRELAARQVTLFVSRKGASDKNINLDVPGEVLKQAVLNAENLWEALYKHHP